MRTRKLRRTPQGPRKPVQRKRAPAPVRRTPRHRLAVIVPACNEEQTIGKVLREAKRLRPDDLIVVVNGSTDGTARMARRCGAHVIRYRHRLGNDVGRAVGALHCDADVYLFLDADFALTPKTLRPLVRAVENGADVAFNSLKWVENSKKPGIPGLDRYFLSLVLQRRSLGLENLLTVPHAVSRRAVQIIGKSTLANPLLATLVALEHGLRVAAPTAVNVLVKNRRRPNHIRQSGEPMPRAFQRIHGDAVEAVWYWLNKYGRRGGFPDLRIRRCFQELQNPEAFSIDAEPDSVSVVLSAPAFSDDVVRLVRELVHQRAEVIVVCEADGAETVPEGIECRVIRVPVQAGYDVAFAIGATHTKGDIIVFSDATLDVTPDVLLQFAAPVRSGAADLVLNNQKPYKEPLKSLHPVHIGSWFANVTAGRRNLGISSLLVPPFAIRRDALQILRPELLMSPCLAQMRAVTARLRLHLGPSIPAVTSCGAASEVRLFHEKRVLGDVLEGLYDWIARHDIRGGFTDEGRRREVIPAREGVYRAQFQSGFVPVDAEPSWLFE